jgi:hypothetical protein
MFVRPGIPIAPAAAGVPETLIVGRLETALVDFASSLGRGCTSTADNEVFASSFLICEPAPVVPSLLLSCAEGKNKVRTLVKVQ